MTNYQYFVNKYRNSQLLIDANLLVLLLVGHTNPNYIQTLKPTKQYTVEDYNLLARLVSNFEIVTTPNILTEVSNLCEKVSIFYKEKIFATLSQMIDQVIEILIYSNSVSDASGFMKFGLSDSIIFKLSKEGPIILTDDLDLHSYILGTGGTAANMNLFRSEYLLG